MITHTRVCGWSWSIEELRVDVVEMKVGSSWELKAVERSKLASECLIFFCYSLGQRNFLLPCLQHSCGEWPYGCVDKREERVVKIFFHVNFFPRWDKRMPHRISLSLCCRFFSCLPFLRVKYIPHVLARVDCQGRTKLIPNNPWLTLTAHRFIRLQTNFCSSDSFVFTDCILNCKHTLFSSS